MRRYADLKIRRVFFGWCCWIFNANQIELKSRGAALQMVTWRMKTMNDHSLRAKASKERRKKQRNYIWCLTLHRVDAINETESLPMLVKPITRMHMCRAYTMCYTLRRCFVCVCVFVCEWATAKWIIEWMGTSKMWCDSESKPDDEKQKFIQQYSTHAMPVLYSWLIRSAYGNAQCSRHTVIKRITMRLFFRISNFQRLIYWFDLNCFNRKRKRMATAACIHF